MAAEETPVAAEETPAAGEKLEINACLVLNGDESRRCCEFMKGKENRCVYATTQPFVGDIMAGKACVRLSRQPNTMKEKERDKGLDVYCHLACTDVFAYGLWVQSIAGESRWFPPHEFKNKLKDFPGMKEMEEELVKAFNDPSTFASSPLSPAAIAAGADPDKPNKALKSAQKLCARLRDYWWKAVEFAANENDLPSFTKRLLLDGAKYVAKLDGSEASIEQLRDSQQTTNGEDSDVDNGNDGF